MHTFSHLFIRELEYCCGYEATSLKEKIYASNKENSKMSGFLVYTASSSSDGSLGGLVRQGRGKNFVNIVISLLERAKWCSNDPICIETKEQGKYSMNYSGCYACALLPEISCENNNILLDRKAIVGSYEDRNFGYFGGLLNENSKVNL